MVHAPNLERQRRVPSLYFLLSTLLRQGPPAQELPDKGCRRVLVDLHGRADLFDPGKIHDDDTIRDFERFLLVMRHEKCGDLQLLLQLFDQPRSSLRTLASSSPNGSSSRRMRGLIASARARATR